MIEPLDYPQQYERLSRLIEKLGSELPGTMSSFRKLQKNAMSENALDTMTKELIALGIAISVRCDGCIPNHVHDALKAGASHDEIMETIGVSMLMGGGSVLVHGAEALAALEQFTAEDELIKQGRYNGQTVLPF